MRRPFGAPPPAPIGVLQAAPGCGWGRSPGAWPLPLLAPLRISSFPCPQKKLLSLVSGQRGMGVGWGVRAGTRTRSKMMEDSGCWAACVLSEMGELCARRRSRPPPPLLPGWLRRALGVQCHPHPAPHDPGVAPTRLALHPRSSPGIAPALPPRTTVRLPIHSFVHSLIHSAVGPWLVPPGTHRGPAPRRCLVSGCGSRAREPVRAEGPPPGHRAPFGF